MAKDAQHRWEQTKEQAYSSFLIQCRSLSDGQRRIKVQHIQSGEYSQAGELGVVTEWTECHALRRPRDPPW